MNIHQGGSFQLYAGGGLLAESEMQKEWDTTKMLLAINSNISKGMSVMEIAKVSEEFHARFDAKEREYR